MSTVKIADVMQPSPVALSRHDSVADARAAMGKHDISALPVVDTDGGLIGIVTTRDLARRDAPSDVPVGRVMSSGVFTVEPGAPVDLAARIMLEHHLHHVIVTEGQILRGIVSSFDLLRLIESRRVS